MFFEQPAAGAEKFWGISSDPGGKSTIIFPPYFGPWWENFYFPTIFRTLVGNLKKLFPTIVVGKNTPGQGFDRCSFEQPCLHMGSI